ncbi:DNA repair protein RecN [Paenibacillus sp. YN15]|uniref:DNA repair protein RecN n=1 Tax=Paenibacillus sp. YN15 TaxID=1742774 RepID=UPI000DCCF51C|nr:DNA repair protein RecN [Paenibacillus sp. YN15]RAV00961.1 DNA repair protein RecN [Paenibacillus sp. YN15]
MLQELSIRNLAVIESVRLSFHNGFHVLTGETGAGKSIIIDALGLIAGGRGASDLVRFGQDKAEIEALFDVPADHPVWEVLGGIGLTAAADEHLIIRRELSVQGKSVSRINGQLVNLSTLREAGERLINIHGQHEHQSLLKAEEHIRWLDLFGGQEIEETRSAYSAAYGEYIRIHKELAALREAEKQALQMQDLYRFQVEEIAEAQLKSGEDECLAEEKSKLGNAEKLYQNVNDSYEALNAGGKALDLVRRAVLKLQDIVQFDAGRLGPVLEQMQSSFYQLEDAAFQLRDYRDSVEFNPERLNEIEDRLNLISSFRRKYGENVEEILRYLEKVRQELAVLDHKEERQQELEGRLARQEKECVRLALKLSGQRASAGLRLSAAIEAELKELHMERTVFHVQIGRQEDPRGVTVDGSTVRLTRSGIDQVEFLIAPNPGEPLRGLGKIASGGELSRMMLALKSIFAKVDRIPVLVFDEVDTGVSGRAAQAIAERMARLSADCQVFSITHLPQVACMADAHYYISKAVEDGRTFTRVKDLDTAERAEELARMLGGVEITETTLSHALEMLAMAETQKRPLTRNLSR